jgi:hypothetical protein
MNQTIHINRISGIDVTVRFSFLVHAISSHRPVVVVAGAGEEMDDAHGERNHFAVVIRGDIGHRANDFVAGSNGHLHGCYLFVAQAIHDEYPHGLA